jgi:hypothetical protein
VLPVSRSTDGVQQDYVREASLPARLDPGTYYVAVSRDARTWTPLAAQQLEVRPDPTSLQSFDVSAPEFGGCKPDDLADDTDCFAKALEAAARAGGGIVHVPAGRWDLLTAGARAADGLVLAPGVQLQGEGSADTTLVHHGTRSLPRPGALLTVLGRNTIQGLSFTDVEGYESLKQSRPVIQLGRRSADIPAHGVEDIVITDNVFSRVGRAIVDSGQPIHRLFITHNEFAAYDGALLMAGSEQSLSHPYRIDDSVVRWNRFVPGSYQDLAAGQGTVATQLGASQRVDFSTNIAAGDSTTGLQDPQQDAPGFSAAFLWSLRNNVEDLLISENQITCSGDKIGDGEAVSLDSSGNSAGFPGIQTIAAAGSDWVRIRGQLVQQQLGQAVADDYYVGHWLILVRGSGVGQARRVVSYSSDRAAGTVTLKVSPAWDLVPEAGSSQLVLERQYWHVYIVANTIGHESPPCRKANRRGPRGGGIVLRGSVGGSTIEGNQQTDTDGIEFLQAYGANTPSCPTCVSGATTAMGLEIRGNVIEGEYDWSSDCSSSGVRGYVVSSATPESPVPVLGFGSLIAHNRISHADGPRGGAIDIARGEQVGTPPERWPLVQSLLVFQNIIRDVNGSPPKQACPLSSQHERTGIRIEGPGNVRDAVLQGNRCERVDHRLDNQGAGTRTACETAGADSCECASH